jgi:hypothetical protein
MENDSYKNFVEKIKKSFDTFDPEHVDPEIQKIKKEIESLKLNKENEE